MGQITITYQEEGITPLTQITISSDIANLLDQKIEQIKSHFPTSPIQGKMDLFIFAIWNGFLKNLIERHSQILNNINIQQVESDINKLKAQLETLKTQENTLTIEKILQKQVLG